MIASLIKENFVTFKQAVKLKELGFDEGCFSIYGYNNSGEFNFSTDRLWLFNEISEYENNNIHPEDLKNSCIEDNAASAPLCQQVFKWFRKKYELLGYAHVSNFNSPTKIRWDYTIKNFGNKNFQEKIEDSYELSLYDTFEEAQIACIDEIIEILDNTIKYEKIRNK